MRGLLTLVRRMASDLLASVLPSVDPLLLPSVLPSVHPLVEGLEVPLVEVVLVGLRMELLEQLHLEPRPVRTLR